MSSKAIQYAAAPSPSFFDKCNLTAELFFRDEHRSAFVFHEEHYEFCRFGLAGVSSDHMNVRRAFVKGLTRSEGYFLLAAYLHDDRTLEHVHKRMCVVTMDGILGARADTQQ